MAAIVLRESELTPQDVQDLDHAPLTLVVVVPGTRNLLCEYTFQRQGPPSLQEEWAYTLMSARVLDPDSAEDTRVLEGTPLGMPEPEGWA